MLTRSVAPVVLALLLAGCASSSTPAAIVVAEKDMKSRPASVVGDRQNATQNPNPGRAPEVRHDGDGREYWVKSTDGHWYQVPRDDWYRVRVGDRLELHGGLPGPPEHRAPTVPCFGPDDTRYRC